MESNTNKQKYHLSTDYLDVGDGHQLYYETYGNPSGIPVVFLHGGPGLGCSDTDKRFFDPQIFFVLFFDQRGAGRSLPKASLENNTTSKLIEDITRLLEELNIPKAIFFGGSWGSTLAMLYAIQHPDQVEALILRGFFPGNKACIDYYEKGSLATFFPEAWSRYERMVPEENRTDVFAYYFNCLHAGDPSLRREYAYEMIYYGMSISKKTISTAEIEQSLTQVDFESKILIQSWFSHHYFFLEDDYIYKQAHQIGETPVFIVQGRYDMVCPPIHAWRLQQCLKNAHLYLLDAGHVSSEPAIERKLIELLQLFY